jgi:hypothetical protein
MNFPPAQLGAQVFWTNVAAAVAELLVQLVQWIEVKYVLASAQERT